MRLHNQIDVSIDKRADLCRRYHVHELALFGSVLRDDFGADSDIDILVAYEPDARVTRFDHFDLQHELEALLGRAVDLAPKDGLRSALRERVFSSTQVIYAA